MPFEGKQGRIHGHQLRTGGQGRKCAFSHFSTRSLRTNGTTHQRTDKASHRVACPQLKNGSLAIWRKHTLIRSYNSVNNSLPTCITLQLCPLAKECLHRRDPNASPTNQSDLSELVSLLRPCMYCMIGGTISLTIPNLNKWKRAL